MATPDDIDSRTEAATPRRREEASNQGRVPYSGELSGGLLLLAAMLLLAGMAPMLGQGLLDAVREGLSSLRGGNLGSERASALLSEQYTHWIGIVGIFLTLLLAIGIATNVSQVGFHVNPEKLEFDVSKLAPTQGFERLFSLASLLRGLQALLKVIALGVLAWLVLRGRGERVITSGSGDVGFLAAQGWSLVLRLTWSMAGVLFVLGAADYAYQRFRFEQSLRMTRQEVKDEIKREEGDPVVRNRIKQIQRELARRRMMAAVPKATVVVTNPTHLAVALRYERGKRGAPRVVAKGRGFLAARIRELARESRVPVLERKLLAQTLYKAVPLGQEIPQALFMAVAELLAFVYRMRGSA